MAPLTDRQFVNVIDHENVTAVETRIAPFAPEAPRILDCDRPLIFSGIGEIAIVRQRDHAFVRLHHDRLGIEQSGIAGRRITGVSDGEGAANTRELLFGKNVGDQSHGFVDVERHAIGGDDACRFLAAMLQRMQAEVGERLRLRMRVDRYHTALVVKFVVSKHSALSS